MQLIIANAQSTLNSCAQSSHDLFQLRLAAGDFDLQAVYFPTGWVLLSQLVEADPALGLVIAQVATKCSVVTSRVIHGPTRYLQ